MEKRIALITGGAKGIGFAIAQRLIADNWHVVLNDLDEDALESAVEQLGDDADYTIFNVGDVEAVRAGVAQVFDTYGHVHALVNNAGVFKSGPLLEVTEGDYDRLQSINLKGAFFVMQRYAQYALRGVDIVTADAPDARQSEQKANAKPLGVIVNIASAAGRGGRPNQSIYGMTKAGLIHLTYSAAQAFAPYLRAYSVCPAAIESDMWSQTVDERRALGGDDAVNAFMARIPMSRAGKPEEVAGVVAFLCSDDAAYMTGNAVDVSGGLHMG